MRKTLSIANVRADGGTQTRVGLDEETVTAYAEAIRNGETFPPIVVFFDGSDHWCADGFHRTEATRRAGRKSIVCEVKRGTRRDAILFAVGANAAHGLRRTNADKRRAVSMLLGDEEWRAKSDRWIAEKCAVGNKLVGDMRREQLCSEHSSPPRTGKDGKARRPPKGKRLLKRAEEVGDLPITVLASSTPSDDGDESDEVISHDGLYRLSCAFSDVFRTWPRAKPLEPLVEWLRVKLGMMRVEAERWNA